MMSRRNKKEEFYFKYDEEMKRNLNNEYKISIFANFAIILAGVLSFGLPFIIPNVIDWIPYNEELFPILGYTLIANSLFNLLKEFMIHVNDSSLKNRIAELVNNDEIVKWIYSKGEGDIDIIENILDMGLVKIHKEKSKAFESISNAMRMLNKDGNLENSKTGIDIICINSLTLFNEFKYNDEVLKFLNNLKGKESKKYIRIITAKPESSYLKQLEIDEELLGNVPLNPGEIKNWFAAQIKDIIVWARENEFIEAKYCNSLPFLEFFRIGERIFVFDKMLGKDGHRYTVYEYSDTLSSNDMFDRYVKYFNELWDTRMFLSKYATTYSLNLKLLTNDNVISEILSSACETLDAIIKDIDSNKYRSRGVRAYISAIYIDSGLNEIPDISVRKQTVDSTMEISVSPTCRYNTNVIIDGRQTTTVQKYNNHRKDFAIREEHAVGEALIYGKPIFKVVDEEKEPYAHDSWIPGLTLITPILINEEKEIYYKVKDNKDKTDDKDEKRDLTKLGKTKAIAVVYFEFKNSLTEFIAPPVRNDEKEYNIGAYDEKTRKYSLDDASYYIENRENLLNPHKKMMKEAERCRDIIVTYLGLDF